MTYRHGGRGELRKIRVENAMRTFLLVLICVIAIVFARRCRFHEGLSYGIYVSERSSIPFSDITKM